MQRAALTSPAPQGHRALTGARFRNSGLTRWSVGVARVRPTQRVRWQHLGIPGQHRGMLQVVGNRTRKPCRSHLELGARGNE